MDIHRELAANARISLIRAFCTTNFQVTGIETVENMSKIWLLVVVRVVVRIVVRSLQTTHNNTHSVSKS